MGFYTEEEYHKKAEEKVKYFVPKEGYEWLNSVQIVEDKKGGIKVVIACTDTTRENLPEGLGERVRAKVIALQGLRDLFDLDHHSRLSPREQIGAMLGDAFFDSIMFEAGSNFHIRSVLNQSDIPKDIQEAIMADLQKMWTKTPK